MTPVVPLAALGAGVGLAAMLGVTQAAKSCTSSKGQIPAAVIARLTAVAYQWAAREGDSSPQSVLAVRTTRAAALHLADPADMIPGSSHTPVYLVVERGHFHPTGIAGIPRSATNLELILSAKKLEVLDYGVGRGSKHRPTVTLVMLQRLGPVSQLAG